jgi:N-acetylmuramoyl-L-alanine amidase
MALSKPKYQGKLGTPTFITVHWTAGSWSQVWYDYHFNIKADPAKRTASLIQTLPLAWKGQHVRGRNSHNIGVTICAMGDMTQVVNGKRIKTGTYHPQPTQVELAAKLIAELQIKLDIADGDVVDHAHWAKIDGYYPERWDCGDLWPVIDKKRAWYKAKLLAGDLPFQYTLNLK